MRRCPYCDPLNQREQVMSQLLAPGLAAPDFTLRVTPDQNLSLGELRDRRVILSFYPADWSPVCGTRSRSTTRSVGNSRNMAPRSSVFRWMGHGVIRLTQSTITFTS